MAENQINFAAGGMNLEQSLSQLKKGQLTYALNAITEGFDGQYVNYQNEEGNVSCVQFPDGYKVIGRYVIYEDDMVVYWLVNPTTGMSQIGKSPIEGCTYEVVIQSECLNFSLEHPILKAVHRKSNCSLQVFWVDGHNVDRFIDFSDLPFKQIELAGNCGFETTNEIDCNKLSINPNFSTPKISIDSVDGDGTMTAGTVQFGIQYANANGDAYTEVYSITNPTPIFDSNAITLSFDYSVNKSIKLSIRDIDNTGYYDYYNIIAIKTVNDTASAELVGTYLIDRTYDEIVYVGQKITDLDVLEIFQKYPRYSVSNDITSVGDILLRDQLSTPERLSYQEIASKMTILWQTNKITKDLSYKKEELVTELRGHMRDEVYPFDLVLQFTDGGESDRFHIPGRKATAFDLEPVFNDDNTDAVDNCEDPAPQPRWKVYNTATLTGTEQAYLDAEDTSSCYTGPYQYGTMAYWESEEEYPCDTDRWGDLAGQKIRHHKFPDSLITHIHDSDGNIYPIGIKISINEVKSLIATSSLTAEQKARIAGFKIVRGNRANNKSVVAKGLIHNVGSYTKDEATYYYPNYPYNDVGEDVFISGDTNPINVDDYGDSGSGPGLCYNYQVTGSNEESLTFEYEDCDGNTKTFVLNASEVLTVCGLSRPRVIQGSSEGTITRQDVCSSTDITPVPPVTPNLQGFSTEGSKRRFVFHSPDTHFYQPLPGNILKLETAEFGKSKGHFVQTKDHAKYKLFSKNLYETAILVTAIIAGISRVVGVSSTIVDGNAVMVAYRTIVDILEKATPRINYAYHYSSYGVYDNFIAIPNNGNKQRLLDIAQYIIPGMASVGDINPINNFQRESSVYLRARKALPYTHEQGAPRDVSRWLPDCDRPTAIEYRDISSYYAALKKPAVSQYGQINSYESVDTGYQFKLSDERNEVSVFGGDIFINRFAYKSKLPYFIDNRVKAPDGSDVFYDEIGNIGTPNYWFSLDSTRGGSTFTIFALPVTKLHCTEEKFAYKKGRMYLFSYGIPYYFCESEVNVDLRQAFNNKEGEFFPHVSSDIPDEWLQESFVSIANDNTYYYNRTYSKQNKETYYSILPPNWTQDKCRTSFPYRAIFSEPRSNDQSSSNRNNWLIYRPSSYYDFPQNYGRLTSVDGMEHTQALVRFENRSQIYNALLTAPTSQTDLYLGQPIFSSQVPPLDLSNTDQGYIGSRHKFLLKTEYGTVMVDDKRGHVFLINGKEAKNLTAPGSGVEQFFLRYLEVRLPSYFPEVPIDNAYNGVGIHGVYDNKYNRFILTKIDYEPLSPDIIYKKGRFYYNNTEVFLNNPLYFCNRSFTISYDLDNGWWSSFHSYIPAFYIGYSKTFLSFGNNKTWRHQPFTFNNFFGEVAPYILEYPYAFKTQDEILQSVCTYNKTLQYVDGEQIEVDDAWFNKAELYNNQQHSGILELVQKPRNNMSQLMKYPIYGTSSKTILYTKNDNLYCINQFWSLVKDAKKPIYVKTCQSLSFDKVLNQENMSYSKMAFRKAPLRAMDLKCRFTLDNRSDTRIVSQFVIAETQKSF